MFSNSTKQLQESLFFLSKTEKSDFGSCIDGKQTPGIFRDLHQSTVDMKYNAMFL